MMPIGSLVLAAFVLGAAAPPPAERATAVSRSLDHPVTTFSIVAYDPETGDYGVAVQSKYFAVGDVVPYAQADTGALATQSWGNLTHGPQGMRLIAGGAAADDVLDQLMADDPQPEIRQVGIVDAEGRPATYTGDDCLPWAGGQSGEHYAVQGNLLAGPQVVEAMASTFEAAPGDLATRLMYALAAGQAAGGDARGRQSAALLVVRAGAGYLGTTDRLIDLHVEDHATPIRELKRLLDIRHAQMASAEAEALLDEALEASEAEHASLIAQARAAAERGVELYRGDDVLWWLVARLRILDGDVDAAVEAGRLALLISPSWPSLDQRTRKALGLPPDVVATLRDADESFRRLWDSL